MNWQIAQVACCFGTVFDNQNIDNLSILARFEDACNLGAGDAHGIQGLLSLGDKLVNHRLDASDMIKPTNALPRRAVHQRFNAMLVDGAQQITRPDILKRHFQWARRGVVIPFLAPCGTNLAQGFAAVSTTSLPLLTVARAVGGEAEYPGAAPQNHTPPGYPHFTQWDSCCIGITGLDERMRWFWFK